MVQVWVLEALDRARTQSLHLWSIAIAGIGFLTDAYDLFVINTVIRLLGRIYYYNPSSSYHGPGKMPAGVYGAVNSMAFCGALLGQLFFGWAGDRFGRRRVYGVTLLLMIVCSINSGLSYGNTPKSVITTLCFFRFWLGFGIGGDYPLSATIVSEYSNVKHRGMFVAAIFSMQGIGILMGSIVTLILSAVFMRLYPETIPVLGAPDQTWHTPKEADFLWRLAFMLGALPAALTFYIRMRLPETARYTALVAGLHARASQDMAGVLDGFTVDDEEVAREVPEITSRNVKPYGLFSKEFVRRHGLELLGTTVCWLSLDVVFYGLSMYQKDMFTAIGWLKLPANMGALRETFEISKAQAYIALVATVPGYYVAVFTIDRLGRKPIQLLGFFMMSVFMVSLAADFTNLRGKKNCEKDITGAVKYCGGNYILFVALYALTFFFANFGPNTTTFVIPSELFPARLRSTCNGIASAGGKLGAIIGAFGFVNDPSTDVTRKYQLLLGVIALFNVVGFCFTFLLPETTGRSLEELSGEHEALDGNPTAVVEDSPLDSQATNLAGRVANGAVSTHPLHTRYNSRSSKGDGSDYANLQL